MCVCVCVCVRERERERERQGGEGERALRFSGAVGREGLCGRGSRVSTAAGGWQLQAREDWQNCPFPLPPWALPAEPGAQGEPRHLSSVPFIEAKVGFSLRLPGAS